MKSNTSIKPSIGFEARGHALKELGRLVSTGHFQHLQITFPTFEDYSKVRDLPHGLPLVVHSNLLNTMGTNDWDRLSAPSNAIRSYKPIQVIEHLTLFRSADGVKRGVFVPSFHEQKAVVKKSICNINVWRDRLGLDVLLENAPVTTEASRYFEIMNEVKQATGCGIALDLPHFVLSLLSTENNQAQLIELAKSLVPEHIHLGGISEKNGLLQDNHQIFSQWMCKRFEAVIKRAEHVTFEQGPKVPINALVKWALSLVEMETLPIAEPDFIGANVLHHEQFNQALAEEEAFSTSDIASAHRVGQPHYFVGMSPTPLELLNTYLPFHYPIESLIAAVQVAEPKVAVRAVAATARQALRFVKLWRTTIDENYVVAFGTGNVSEFAMPILPITDDWNGKVRREECEFVFLNRDKNWIGLLHIQPSIIRPAV